MIKCKRRFGFLWRTHGWWEDWNYNDNTRTRWTRCAKCGYIKTESTDTAP